MSYLLLYVAFVAFFFASGLGQECEGVSEAEAYHAGREDENNVILQAMQEVVDVGGTREVRSAPSGAIGPLINKNHELVHATKEAAKGQLKVKKLKGNSFGKYLKAGMAVGARKKTKKSSSSTKARKNIKASKIVGANANAARMNALKISPRRRASMTKVVGHNKPKKPAAMKVLKAAAAKVPRRRRTTAAVAATPTSRRRSTAVTRRRRTRRRRSEIHRRRRTEVRRRRRRRGPVKMDKSNKLGITRRRRRARKHRRRRTTKVGARRRRRRGRRHRRRGTKTKPVHHVIINPIKITVNNGSTAKMTTTTKSSSGSKGHVHYIKVKASVIKKMLAKSLAKKKTR